jgi:hypothetical protein
MSVVSAESCEDVRGRLWEQPLQKMLRIRLKTVHYMFVLELIS